MSSAWPYLAAILPTILVGILFYFLIKGMLEGDRRERLAQKQFEAEQDRRADAVPGDTARSPQTPERDSGAADGPSDSANNPPS